MKTGVKYINPNGMAIDDKTKFSIALKQAQALDVVKEMREYAFSQRGVEGKQVLDWTETLDEAIREQREK